MNRLRKTPLLLIATAVVAGGSAVEATPPKDAGPVSTSKDADPGNPASAVGSTKRTVDPIRSGVSEAGWLDALRNVRVTELQVPLITSLVRTHLDRTDVWRRSMGIELGMVVEEIRRIRESGGDIPPELTTRVRMIRGSMPKWNTTQRLILAELTPGQVESLLLEIDEVKAKRMAKRTAELRERAMRDMKKVRAADEETRPAGIEPDARPEAEAAEPDAKVVVAAPWSFAQTAGESAAEPDEDSDGSARKSDG